jgi:hypothetical protein
LIISIVIVFLISSIIFSNSDIVLASFGIIF